MAIVPCSRRLLIGLLLGAGLLLDGRAARSALAQAAPVGVTPPPGPILATGAYISTDNNTAIATWEEYDGGLLYIWTGASDVTRAVAGPCSGGGTAVCYRWIRYVDKLTDPYNADLWTPVQRGCLVLGADPLTVGEADGLIKPTDVYTADGTFAPVIWPNVGEGTLNPAASDVAPAPSGWSPAGYDQCYDAAAVVGSGCAQWDVTGTWRTSQSNNFHLMFSFSQSGTTISGTASLTRDEGIGAGYGGAVNAPLSGTLVGNQIDFIVSMPPKLDRSLSRGHYAGTVSDGSISGTSRDDAVLNGPTITWTGTGPTNCVSTGSAGGGDTTSAQVCTWTGPWDAPGSPYLILTQSDNQVTGTFGFWGTVQGTISGDVMTGTVTDAGGTTNSLELHMSAVIDAFSFQYSRSSMPCQLMAGVLGGSAPLNFQRR